MRQTKHYPFSGGIDLVTSPLALKPGFLIGSSNYEISSISETGYRRIDGYERYDGNTKPSESDYWIVEFDSGSTIILNGQVLGELAAPTINMVALADAVLTSGTWAGGDAAGYVAVGFDSTSGLVNAGNLVDNDALFVGATNVATVNGAVTANSASTDALDTTYKQATIELSRAVISAVPGEGAVRGVWTYKGSRYAFRDNVGATECRMYQSSSTGWVLQSLGREIAFTSGGITPITVGDTITGATSAATAIITAIAITSGSFSAGDATGWLYFASQTGLFQAENLDVGASTNIATIAGDSTGNTLPPGGKYEFINENFYGNAGSIRMYGCNGVGYGFEFDGTNFHFVHTGMVDDKPIHVTEHKKHLFFAFTNGSNQHSSIGVPLEWNVITGAAEIGTGDEVTGYVTLPNDALGILNRNRTYILYGTSTADWNLTELSDESGAIEWTIQRIGRPMYLDDRGLTNMEAVQAFGDFKSAIFSQKIKPLLDTGKSKVIGSTRVRDKNQYRLWFSDMTFVIASFDGNKLSGFTSCEYSHVVSCSCSSEDVDGNEELYFGSDDGYVYQMDKGTSFDGGAISSFIRPAFNHLKSPEHKKRFFKAVLEVDSPDQITLNFTPDFDYSETEDITTALSVASGGGFYNVDNWDEFFWSEPGVGNPEAYIDGTGKNLGMTIFHESIYDAPHILHGITLHYSLRGVSR